MPSSNAVDGIVVSSRQVPWLALSIYIYRSMYELGGLLSEFVLVTLGIDDDAELTVDQIVGVIVEDRAYLAKS